MLKLRKIKEQEGTLKKLDNLLNDSSKRVHGVFYTNSFFTQRYLTRSHVLSEDVNIKDKEVRLSIVTRLEEVGLMEIENTLHMLVKHEAGDVPGLAPEGLYEGYTEDEDVDRPHIPEVVSVKQHLFSVDLLLIMREPTITYKEFTIAGSKFTLLNIYNELEEGFNQTVSLLFGDSDKLYFFSHFHNKELNQRDSRMILDMIVDENITGKAVTGIKVETANGLSNSLFPVERLIGSYTNLAGDLIFNTDTGYVKIPANSLKNYKMECKATTSKGDYRVALESKNDKIFIYFE